MQALATTANRMSRSRRKVMTSVGAIGLFVFATALTAPPARSGESSVSPAENEMQIIRDQLQRQRMREHSETATPKETRVPDQQSNGSSARQKRMDESPENAPDKP
jgi:hypothetical protein